MLDLEILKAKLGLEGNTVNYFSKYLFPFFLTNDKNSVMTNLGGRGGGGEHLPKKSKTKLKEDHRA